MFLPQSIPIFHTLAKFPYNASQIAAAVGGDLCIIIVKMKQKKLDKCIIPRQSYYAGNEIGSLVHFGYPKEWLWLWKLRVEAFILGSEAKAEGKNLLR